MVWDHGKSFNLENEQKQEKLFSAGDNLYGVQFYEEGKWRIVTSGSEKNPTLDKESAYLFFKQCLESAGNRPCRLVKYSRFMSAGEYTVHSVLGTNFK